MEHYRDFHTNADEQKRIWYLHFPKASFTDTYNETTNPKVHVQVDATKSQICKRVATGHWKPEYKFVCEDE